MMQRNPLNPDVRLGAHETKGVVTFTLFAPNHSKVELIGDFNGWERGVDLLQSELETPWTLQKPLPAGRHAYQFVVDDVVICDPYARAIDDKRDPPRAVVTVGQEPYRWRNDKWDRPLFNDLIIYELHIGDFTPQQTFQAAEQRLDYLRDLGITAIQLLPVTQSSPQDYWGYEPVYFFAVENDYGTADDLRHFIDEAHGLGIAVIMDIVLAHSGHEHPFARLYPTEASPWYGTGIGGQNEFGFPTFDHRKPAARAFARDVQTYWLEEFRADGFRYDYVKNIGYGGEEGAAYLIRCAREVSPEVYLIGEHLPEEPKKTTSVDFDGVWHARTSRGLKSLLGEREVDKYQWTEFSKTASVLDALAQGYPRSSWTVHYLASHDEDRTANELKAWGFKPKDVLLKLMLGATILLTVGGEPMFLHGEEWGEDAPCSQKANPIHWERLDTEAGQALFRHYRRLCALRREHPAMRAENFRFLTRDDATKTLSYYRWNTRGDAVLVAANFRGQAQSVPIPFPEPGPWHEVLENKPVEATNESTPINLPPYSAAIFTRTPQ